MTTVHIAGGQRIPADREERTQRLFDDHLHAVPDIVYEMLEEVAAMASQPLTVILERDGGFPGMQGLLFELNLARAALRRRRSGREEEIVSEKPSLKKINAPDREERWASLEDLLAHIYVDGRMRAQFLSSPIEFACHYGLSKTIAAELAKIDRAGLEMAAASFQRKRRLKNAAEKMPGWTREISDRLRPIFRQFTSH